MDMKKIFLLFAGCLLLWAAGCRSYEGDFVEKSEEELAAMEKLNDQAHLAFMSGNYSDAETTLRSLTTENTVSRPLYQMELLSVLLMSGKNEEAHKLMLSIYRDIEMLFDPQLEEKAVSMWHGEVNKVFKGDAYERSTFYAFMALSFIREGNWEDALRCVKNGLLADADSNRDEALDDYGMLFYIGYIAALKMDDPDTADDYMKGLLRALGNRREVTDAEKERLRAYFTAGLENKKPNVILVLWTGTPPSVVCGGSYNEKRAIIRGSNPFDLVSVSVGSGKDHFAGGFLGDVEYQATSRGGRLMDNVLSDKATAKKAMEVSANILYIAAPVCISLAGQFSDPVVGLSLLGAGLGCYLVGGTVHLVGYMINPAADGRYWRNLPGQFSIVPLTLEPGEYNVVCKGYKYSDCTARQYTTIKVAEESKGMQVIYMPMMTYGSNSAWFSRFKAAQDYILPLANANRMAKELK